MSESTKALHVRCFKTGEVVKKLDVSTRSDREIERIMRGMLIMFDVESKMRAEDLAEGQRLRSETIQAVAGMATAICRLNMLTILTRSGETLEHATIRTAADWLRKGLGE